LYQNFYGSISDLNYFSIFSPRQTTYLIRRTVFSAAALSHAGIDPVGARALPYYEHRVKVICVSEDKKTPNTPIEILKEALRDAEFHHMKMIEKKIAHLELG